MLRFAWILAVAGCGLGGRFADEREVCDAYLACAGEVEPDGIGQRVADYGEQSACWDDPDQAELCATACQIEASALVGRAEVQRDQCELAAAGVEGGEPLSCEATMTPKRFVADYHDRMCDEALACGDGQLAEFWCDEVEDADTTPDGCTLDPVAACDCVQGDYVCQEATGYYNAYVLPPTVCAEIYDCGQDR